MDVSVDLACGDTSADNSTYLTMTKMKFATTEQTCTYTICPKSNFICRIRFDFTVFEIAGPVTGQTIAAVTDTENNRGGAIGDCDKDYFFVSSPGLSGSPVICGYNSNQHSKSFGCTMHCYL